MTTVHELVKFERKLPTEDADIAEIVRDILIVQARFAAEQKRPLGRGTHTKGVCARATFEVFDAAKALARSRRSRRAWPGALCRAGRLSRPRSASRTPRRTFQADSKRTCARCRFRSRCRPESAPAAARASTTR